MFAGVKNRGVINGLLRIVFEDIGSFDNAAVCVVQVGFKIETWVEGVLDGK